MFGSHERNPGDDIVIVKRQVLPMELRMRKMEPQMK